MGSGGWEGCMRVGDRQEWPGKVVGTIRRSWKAERVRVHRGDEEGEGGR